MKEFNFSFSTFLRSIEMTPFETNKTSTGVITIQQSVRNELRRKGLEALVDDLTALYGDEFDVVETKDGIIIVAENEPNGFTFSWELKSTIKSVDFDPFIAASAWDKEKELKEEKKKNREEAKRLKAEELEKKRATKLREVEGKGQDN